MMDVITFTSRDVNKRGTGPQTNPVKSRDEDNTSNFSPWEEFVKTPISKKHIMRPYQLANKAHLVGLYSHRSFETVDSQIQFLHCVSLFASAWCRLHMLHV